MSPASGMGRSEVETCLVYLYIYINIYIYLYIYILHIIRTGSMSKLKLCALFVVSTNISRLINENARKMAKTKIFKFKFMRQMTYHLVGHEILNKTVYSFQRYC